MKRLQVIIYKYSSHRMFPVARNYSTMRSVYVFTIYYSLKIRNNLKYLKKTSINLSDSQTLIFLNSIEQKYPYE